MNESKSRIGPDLSRILDVTNVCIADSRELLVQVGRQTVASGEMIAASKEQIASATRVLREAP